MTPQNPKYIINREPFRTCAVRMHVFCEGEDFNCCIYHWEHDSEKQATILHLADVRHSHCSQKEHPEGYETHSLYGRGLPPRTGPVSPHQKLTNHHGIAK